MFERLWIALGIMKRPAVSARPVTSASALAPAMAQANLKPAWQGARPAAKGSTPRLAAVNKQPPVTVKRRRSEDDDDGFPATQVGSFSDHGGRRTSTLRDDDERDVPMPFRSHGGGHFGGGGASGRWDYPDTGSSACARPAATTTSWASSGGDGGKCGGVDGASSDADPAPSGGASND